MGESAQELFRAAIKDLYCGECGRKLTWESLFTADEPEQLEWVNEAHFVEPTSRLYCVNRNCSRHEIRYRVPVVPLEQADVL